MRTSPLISCLSLLLISIHSFGQHSYASLPKVELHLHLDCSLSYDVVKKIDPDITPEEYRSSFIAPPKCRDLADYIKRAVKGIELMQTKEQLRLVTLDLFRQLKKDNVVYAEIRFAPLQHTSKGLTPAEVVSAVNQATEEGIKEFNIDAGIILCTLRHYSEKQSLETVKLVEQFKGTRVVGFDIAADEAGFPVDNHIKAFQFAKQHQLKSTAHAGEAKGAESVWETVHNFHPDRIGHGVRSIEDEKLLNFIKEKDIHLEVCPTSNVQTNVFENIEHHSADKLYNKGLSIGINTDARTISNVDLSHEYELLEKIFGWNLEHFSRCNIEAINHSFAENVVKEKVRNLIIYAYGKRNK